MGARKENIKYHKLFINESASCPSRLLCKLTKIKENMQEKKILSIINYLSTDQPLVQAGCLCKLTKIKENMRGKKILSIINYLSTDQPLVQAGCLCKLTKIKEN